MFFLSNYALLHFKYANFIITQNQCKIYIYVYQWYYRYFIQEQRILFYILIRDYMSVIFHNRK